MPQLEIKSISITRLKLKKPSTACEIWWTWNQKHLDYEIETTSTARLPRSPVFRLKSKASRLRDWNFDIGLRHTAPSDELEIKSISITRLKHISNTSLCHSPIAWNQKHLDYEIETFDFCFKGFGFVFLEIKSISITRLKRRYFDAPPPLRTTSLKSKASRLRDWNLDTETEQGLYIVPWNQKHLDYEIETIIFIFFTCRPWDLKSKASRLRDWNRAIIFAILRAKSLEIKSISITRLKLLRLFRGGFMHGLEIKSISITRLKR